MTDQALIAQLLGALNMVLDDPDAMEGRPRTYECVMEAIAAAETREGGDMVAVDRKTLQALKASINGECYMGAAWECDTISALLAKGDV